ncbi:duf159 domain protein [Moniliophthora roreri]|uniref:DUF159-domain-containing protein n=1 Tax=Moniliophthora roreri TaxID=221103 RepID=A0A0W0EVC1_MONRR|nr:duf159 domain protein [Moniliophthora roreri]
MCGRFALHLRHQEIRDRTGYNLDIGEWIDEDQFVPRYNIAPRTQAPVIRRRRDASSGERSDDSDASEFVMQSMKWGLVPHWSKHEDKTLSTTNARSENLAEGGGMWTSMKARKRCVVVCEGYYEWLTKGKDKLPHFTKHRDGRLMLLAGLYDSVVLEGQTQPLWTFAIVTTAANNEFSWLHDRQPVILSTPEALQKWLNTSSQSWTSELSKFVLQPYHDSAAPLECYQVPKEVGKVGTESPSFILPVAQRKDGIQAMFSKQRPQPKASPIPKASSGKLKRSLPPSPPQKVELVDSEGDDEVQIVDPPESFASKKVKKEKAPDSPSKKQKSKSPAKPKKQPPTKGQITSFFSAKS